MVNNTGCNLLIIETNALIFLVRGEKLLTAVHLSAIEQLKSVFSE